VPQAPFAPTQLPFPLRDYQLIGKIGKGAQASVYLARRDGDLGFRRNFAIKIVGTLEAGGGRELQMIANEANALAGIYHPNVVQVVDFRSDGALFFLVMELVQGPNIRVLLNRLNSQRTQMPVADALSIASQVAEGLICAHELRDDTGQPIPLIHRDLKPENIILSNAGLVKLVDFGLVLGRASPFDEQQSAGTTCGTPAYMSPEQTSGDSLGPESDLFAFGSVLFELFTGQALFEGTTPMETMIQVNKTMPARSPDLLQRICPDAIPILAKCLARKPQDRYRGAALLLRDLEDLRAGIPERPDLQMLLQHTQLRSLTDSIGPEDKPHGSTGAEGALGTHEVELPGRISSKTTPSSPNKPAFVAPWEQRKARPSRPGQSTPSGSYSSGPARRSSPSMPSGDGTAPWERRKKK